MIHRLVLLALGLALSGTPVAGSTPAGRYEQVVVEPARTSIYVGSVTLTMPAFSRRNEAYESRYHAKVFPYFFSSEQGRITIGITGAMLHELEQGRPIEFKGQGINDGGSVRRIEGTATPTDATHGRLKVRVFVSPRIELIFNTTYRFEGVPDA